MRATRPGLARFCRAAKSIQAEVGTPFYAYDWQSLVGAVRYLFKSADDVGLGHSIRFYLAFFALPNFWVHKRLCDLDDRVGITCNTREEIQLLKCSGWDDWQRVVFTGGVLPERDLLAVAETGCILNVASVGNLKAVLNSDDGHRIGLRLDLTNNALKGIRDSEFNKCLKLARDAGRRLSCLHAYPGTEVWDTEKLTTHARALLDAFSRFPVSEEVNFGGGFWYDYKSANGEVDRMTDLAAYFQAVRGLAETVRVPADVKLTWEPGRIVFAGAGFFVTEVIEMRERGLTKADVYVDASFTQFPSPKIRNRNHVVLALDSAGNLKTGPPYDVRICGATTLSTDQLLPEACSLPRLNPGDLLVILDAGAYGRAGSYNFLGKMKPPEILIDGDHWEIVRVREARDELSPTPTGTET